MSRYEIGGEGEDACEPGSNGQVLRNKLHITDPREMDLAEARALVAAIETSYSTLEDTTRFSVALLCQMHRWWLEGMYAFAGQIRAVNLSKGGVMFAPAAYLETALRDLDSILAEHTPCFGLDQRRLVSTVALVHGELALAHPFREGNGRLARWLADLMVLQAGHPPLDWGFERETDAKRERYFKALRKAFAKDFSSLERVISEALSRVSDPLD